MIRISLRAGIRLSADGPSSLQVEAAGRQTRLSGLDGKVQELLLSLCTGPRMWDGQLTGRLPGPGGQALEPVLAQLAERRLIQFSCAAGARELMVAVPTGGPSSFDCRPVSADQRVRLSRFSYLRNLDGKLVIEAPQRFLRIGLLAPEVAALLPGLAHGESITSLCEQNPTCGKELTTEAVQFLLAAGVIGVLSGEDRLGEDTDAELAPREFHDVAFHSRTRRGLTGDPFGAKYPFLGHIPPALAVKPPMSARAVGLGLPDLPALDQTDPSLVRVMEERRSLRRYGPCAITLDELSEFLYRTARVRFCIPAQPAAGILYDATNRPYPSGGATYDLELYLTVQTCTGIDSGIYHYEPVEHALSLICDRPALVSAMSENARRQSGQPDTPPIVITLASRFNRLGWKYRAISYATTLKNVGVLYEAMYLAATAMGLAPCALGGGDSVLFSRATRLHPLVESSVGEFMLGPRSPLDSPGTAHQRLDQRAEEERQ